MRVAFFGTPEFALPSLRALHEEHELVLVLTRPDKARSRGKQLVPSPVKQAACELGLPLVETNRMSAELNEQLRSLKLDLIVVAAFGCIIPQETLDIPRDGCLNVHGSLLPRWRGAAPLQRAILAGDERVGISIMRVVQALDAGPYCRQASIDASAGNFSELSQRLAELGASELLYAIREIEQGTAQWTEQCEADVSYATKIEKAEMLLDPRLSAQENLLKIRASNDTAPARVEVAGRKLRVLRGHMSDVDVLQGQIETGTGRLLLGCASGTLELDAVRPDGKRDMSAAALIAGLKGAPQTWALLS